MKTTPAEPLSFEAQSPTGLAEIMQPEARTAQLTQTSSEDQRLSQRTELFNSNAVHRPSLAPRASTQKPMPALQRPEAQKFTAIEIMGNLAIRKSGGTGPRLTTHGGPFMTEIEKPVCARELARRLIENDPRWAKTNTPLEMLSCYSAVGGKVASQAQVLANQLGRNVVGFPGRVNHLANTDPITFKPQKGLKAARAKLLNSTMHYLLRLPLAMYRLARRLHGA